MLQTILNFYIEQFAIDPKTISVLEKIKIIMFYIFYIHFRVTSINKQDQFDERYVIPKVNDIVRYYGNENHQKHTKYMVKSPR